MKNNNNRFIVSYIFDDKAPVISLWIQSGCGQIALMLCQIALGVRSGPSAIWCLGDLTCDRIVTAPSINTTIVLRIG